MTFGDGPVIPRIRKGTCEDSKLRIDLRLTREGREGQASDRRGARACEFDARLWISYDNRLTSNCMIVNKDDEKMS